MRRARMMRRWLRVALGTGAFVVAGGAMLAGTGLLLADQKAARRIDLPAGALALPAASVTAAAVDRGRYLYESRGCTECHGPAGGGRRFVDAGAVRLAGPDITAGGRTRDYGPADWVRAVRHGVAPDGRPLRVMPSEDYARMNDADLGALVAYIRQLPPQQGAAAEIELPWVARLMYGFGLLDDAADRIDHRQPLPPPVPEAASVEHGRYVAQMCVGCHGPGFSGGRIPGTPPDWPAAANLTSDPSGSMARYDSAESWSRMMRSGQRADGSRIRVMPFEALAKLNDTDLEALRLFLHTLPARPAGGR